MPDNRLRPEDLLPDVDATLERTREVSRVVSRDGRERVIFERTEEVTSGGGGVTEILKTTNRSVWDCAHPVLVVDQTRNLNIGGECGCGALVCDECFQMCEKDGCGVGICRSCASVVGEKVYCPEHAGPARNRRLFTFGWLRDWLRKEKDGADETVPRGPEAGPRSIP